MKVLVGAFNQEKALVGAFSVIVQPVVEPMDRFTAPDPGVQRGHQGPGARAQHLQRPARPLHHPPQAAAAHGRGAGGLQLGFFQGGGEVHEVSSVPGLGAREDAQTAAHVQLSPANVPAKIV